VSSPLQRTRETAEGLGLPVTLDERFIELDYGALDGTPLAEVPTDLWQRWTSDLDVFVGKDIRLSGRVGKPAVNMRLVFG
jgi:broad specificity phosphatase PhoE